MLGMSENVTNPHVQRALAREADLSIDRIRELLDYELDTGVLRRRISLSKHVRTGNVAGCKDKKGYNVVKINGKSYFAHRLAFAIHHGRWPRNELDHVNGDRSDNRIVNLREATRAENMCNGRNKLRTNTSGVPGVCWHKHTNKWRAQINIKTPDEKSKQVHLGLFEDIAEASVIVDLARSIYHGDFAALNTPPIDLFYPFLDRGYMLALVQSEKETR